MRAVVLLSALIAVASAGVSAQEDLRVMQTVTLPRTVYVGDRAELRVGLRVAESLSLSEPDSLPPTSHTEFHDLRLTPRGGEYELRLVLTPYQPGTLTLPPIELGDVVVRELSLHVSSVLEGGETEPSPPHGQAALPYTRVMIGGLAGLLLGVPIVILGLARWGRERLERLMSGYRRRRPYRRFLKALRTLENRIDELDARSFYIELLQELRRYFSHKLDRDLMAATSSEVGSYLRHIVPDLDDRKTVVDLFRTGDLVKFAAQHSRLGERRGHIEELRRILDRVEHAARREAEKGKEKSDEEELRRVGA